MTHDSLLDQDWSKFVGMLGGAEALRQSARESGAFRRARNVRSAADLLRLVLAYALSGQGLRATAAWARATDVADVSNVALLQRLRRCGDWLALLVGQLLQARMPGRCHGRLIRIVDATAVPKAAAAAKRGNGLWRIHSAFDLPEERFGAVVLTDQRDAERLDRLAVVPGEIRIGDRVHLNAEAIGNVLDQGGDVLVRAGWKSATWQDDAGNPLDLPALLRAAAANGRIDRPIRLVRKAAPPLTLRLVAQRKPAAAIAEAHAKARRAARREGTAQVSAQTLLASEWLLLVTSLPLQDCSADDVLALYRLRWRIELAFKRLKSLVGLKGPPGGDERSAKPYLLAHLLMILLLEPLVDALEDSPRWANAA